MNSPPAQDSMPASPENQSLSGQSVLITRPERHSQMLAEKLQFYGAKVFSHPVIKIVPPHDQNEVRDCMEQLDQFGALAFLSRNAASCFAEAVKDEFGNRDQWPSLPQISAMGRGTEAQLYEETGLQAEFLPAESNSQSMAEMLVGLSKLHDWKGQILIIRAQRGSEVLANDLESAKVPYRELAIYDREDVALVDTTLRLKLLNGDFDWVTVTSSAISKNVARLFEGCLNKVKIVSISPQTTAAATEAGLTVDAEAERYNMDGLVEAIVKHRLENS